MCVVHEVQISMYRLLMTAQTYVQYGADMTVNPFPAAWVKSGTVVSTADHHGQ